ncbi:MAG: hypothetical protein PHO01_01065 [Desulfotomaculaceae bacterium]|nr:hypothetical protein [Desulfotomaculaceae bacterium]
MSKLVITFVCENRHDVESVTIDLDRLGQVSKEDIWRLRTKGSRCAKCGSAKLIYRTSYKK